jgi:adenylate cyclase
VPFDTTPHVITALLALGMALAFILADRHSPTSRALALFLVSIGLSIGVSVLIEGPLIRRHGQPAWGGIFALPEALAFFFAYEWLLRVRRTVPAGSLYTIGPDRLVRVAQGLSILYWLVALAFPAERHQYFIGEFVIGAKGASRLWFWVFAMPLLISLALGIFSGLLLLNRRPDRAESLRMLAFLAGAPFMASGLVLPAQQAPLGTAIGLLIFLVGAVQYHVTQGRRAQFLSRFLAPQVADMVRRRGLKSATDERTLELSAVYCDLRGFTAFSEATSSKHVIRILREYYDAVGSAAAEFGGTIKDQAGDGVLILVGAPIPYSDHARRALELAKRIREVGIELCRRWSDAQLHLGVGVGVASGFVTVGVIGAASRLEYTAVGPAVNLAARFCAEATHGEVLVDQRTMELAEEGASWASLRPGQALTLKGFQQPVQSYVLASA